MSVVLSRLFILFFVGLLITMLGCSAEPAPTAVSPSTSTPIPPTTEPTTAPTGTAVPDPTPSLPPPTAAPTIAPTAESVDEETAVDPPLIIANSNGVFAVAADGSGVDQLVTETVAIGGEAYGYQSAFSPDGRFLAYTSPSGEPTALHLLDITSGETRLITPLLSEETQPHPEDDCLGLDNNTNRCQAAFTVGDVAWSPDGEKLAFISAHAGPSSDVYVYTVADEQIRQLSSGETAVSHLYWSPNSQTIFYYAIRFASGAGSETVLGGWAVQVDDAQNTQLDNERTTLSEMVSGWLDDETIFIYSLDRDFCGADLRSHNVQSGETKSLFPTTFNPGGVAMQPNGTMLIAAPCFTVQDWAIYFRKPDNEIVVVPDARLESPTALRWSDELNAFYAVYEDGWQLISGDGQLTTYADLGVARPETVPPGAVSSTENWAWREQDGKGIWVQTNAPGSQPVQIFTEHADHLMWNPAGDTLFFVAGRNPAVLYAAKAPEFEATAVTTNQLGNSYEAVLMNWLQP